MHRFALTMFALAALACSAPETESQAKPEQTFPADQIEIAVDGKPFTTFYYGPDAPKPYLHPLRAADGTVVTRAYPMSEDVEGEAHDHPHHRGLWFTHGDVNGYDFWANELGYDQRTHKGKVVLEKVHEATDDMIHASFLWLSPEGETMLTEHRTMNFGGDAELRTVDFDVSFIAGDEPVKFGDTKEGFFAVRIAHTMRELTPEREPGQGVIVNAEGAMGAENTWGKASPWVDYSGPVGDKVYGIAIFDHPENPKHPTYWHVRNYGLFAANQFGEHDYYDDETRDGSVTIQAGEILRFRYRVVIHPGDAREAAVGALYEAWK